ncbi:MAG: hypothetical protein AAB652_02500 [Patescibacteria group bacterium]
MKTFTCKEIMNNEGGCDMEFSGDDMMDVAGQCGKHVAGTTDEAHKPMRDMMSNPNHTEEEKKKWFAWFQGLWDAK